MTLPVTLPFHEDESPISLVSRLARANCYTTMQSLLASTYTSRDAIVRGDHDALTEISRLSGVSIERLASASIVRQWPGSNWKLGHAVFNKEMRVGKIVRYCPVCVLNDTETAVGRPIARPYARSWWTCGGIESCPEHQRKLVEHAVSDLDQRDDFATFVEQNIHRILSQAEDDVRSSAPMLDLFLRGRIFHRAETGNLVDTLDEHIVAELSGYMGKFIAIHKLTDLQIEATDQREWGFGLIRKGQAELERVIIETIENKRPMARFALDFFGPLVLWLRRNKLKAAYEPVITLFQEIAERNMPFGPGMEFVRPVEKRHLFCVNSAHEEYGIHKKRIKTLIVQHGLTTRLQLHNSSIYFDAAAARLIFYEANATVNGKEAASVLGVGEASFRRLVEAGILGSSELRKKRDHLHILKSDFEDFVAKLIKNAEVCNVENPKWRAPIAGRTFGFSFAQIIEEIIKGRVSVRIMTGSEGVLKRMRVRFDLLKPTQKYTPVEDETHASHVLATRLLGAPGLTLNQLIKRGYVREKPAYRRSLRLIEKASISEFKENYISLTNLRKNMGYKRFGTRTKLSELGVFPLLGLNTRFTSFYSIADLRKKNLI